MLAIYKNIYGNHQIVRTKPIQNKSKSWSLKIT